MPKKSKARYEKSTTGCRTCKVRRIKCDETLPQCLRCTATGRHCDGPRPHGLTFVVNGEYDGTLSPVSPQAVETSTGAASILNRLLDRTCDLVGSPTLNPSSLQQPPYEQSAFALFVRRAAPVLSGTLDLHFWSQLVPQAACQSSIVWNAVVSVGLLWEHPVSKRPQHEVDRDDLDERYVRALQCYDRAITGQRAILATYDYAEFLLVCTLFASIELHRRNYRNGLQTIRAGYPMLASYLAMPGSVCLGETEATLIKLYMRNACFMMTSDTDTSLNMAGFLDIEGARTHLFRIMCSAYGLIKETFLALTMQCHCLSRLADRRSYLLALLEMWHRSFKEIARIEKTQVHTTPHLVLDALYDYSQVVRSWLLVGTSITDNTLCRKDAIFHEVIQTAKDIIADYRGTSSSLGRCSAYFLEMTVLPPLFFTVTFASMREVGDQAYALMTQNTSQHHGEQVHGLMVVGEVMGTSTDERCLNLQLFRTVWTDNDKETFLSSYANIAI